MEKLYSTAEFAQFLGVHEQSVVRLRWQKRGPAYLKTGKIVRYRESDIQAWLAKLTIASDGKPIRRLGRPRKQGQKQQTPAVFAGV
ncbi:MAG: helix-turn-helix domain-containing protein [Ferrovibrio sp.]